MNNSVMKYLAASTNNLPQEEFDRLDVDDLVISATGQDTGMWVWVRSADDMGNLPETMPALTELMTLARAHGCAWIHVDEGALLIPGTPSWEW